MDKKEYIKIIIIGLCVCVCLIVIGYIFSPTDFTISLDENIVKATENIANIDISPFQILFINIKQSNNFTTIDIDTRICNKLIHNEPNIDRYWCNK